MSLLIAGAFIVAAVAIGVAFYKHGTLQSVLASAKKEATYLETLAGSVSAEAKVAFAGAIARLKNLT